MLTTQTAFLGAAALAASAVVVPYTQRLDASSAAAVDVTREEPARPPPVDEGDRLVARTTALVKSEAQAGAIGSIADPTLNRLGTQVQGSLGAMMAAYQQVGSGDWLGLAANVAGQAAALTDSSFVDSLAQGLDLARSARDLLGSCTTSVTDCAFDLPVVLGKVGKLGKTMAFSAADTPAQPQVEYGFAQGVKLTPYADYLAQQGVDVEATLAMYDQILLGEGEPSFTPASVRFGDGAPTPTRPEAPALVPDPKVPGKRELALGLDGPDVYSLQLRLRVEATGKVDQATLAAYAAWRTQQGLPASPRVTLEDLRALGVPSSYTQPAPPEGLVWPAVLADPALAEKLGVDDHVAAFMMAVSVGEGTSHPDGYATGFGGVRFDPSLGHPGALDPDLYLQNEARWGKRTDASGRYQWLSTTWDPTVDALNARLAGVFEVRVARDGVNRFDERYYVMDPIAQDAAAVQLLREIGAYDALVAGDIETAVARSASTWSSLPAGIEENDRTGEFYGNYRRALEAIRARRTAPASPR